MVLTRSVTGLEKLLDKPLPEAEVAVRRALLEEGFGILTEIDVAATFQAKLGIRRPPLKILGACNPAFAHRALTLDPSLALVLPCNVVLEEVEGRTRVDIADPRVMVGFAHACPDLNSLGDEAAKAIERALARLGA